MAGIPRIPIPEIKSVPEYAFEALVKEVKRFQDGLSDNSEVGIFANGGDLPIHVESVRMSGPMVVFDGLDGDGRQSRIIQHYTQISVQMVAVNKLQDEPRRIGF